MTWLPHIAVGPVTVCWHVMSVRLSGREGGRESRVTLAAVPVVSRAEDQVAQEAQSEAHRGQRPEGPGRNSETAGRLLEIKKNLPRLIMCLRSEQNVQRQ